jgi:hypothetical protein
LYNISNLLAVFSQGIRGFAHAKSFGGLFDLMNALVFFIFELILVLMSHSTPVFERCAFLAHAILFARLLCRVPAFRELKHALETMSSMLAWQALFLLCGFYFFALVGEATLAGFIGHLNKSLEGTEFQADDYYGLNFQTPSSGMVTLFTLMARNNWNIVVQGYVAATGNVAPWVFFLVVYIILDLVMFNLLLAQIIDAFMIIRVGRQIDKDSGLKSRKELRGSAGMRDMTMLQKLHGLDASVSVPTEEDGQQAKEELSALSRHRHSQLNQFSQLARLTWVRRLIRYTETSEDSWDTSTDDSVVQSSPTQEVSVVF